MLRVDNLSTESSQTSRIVLPSGEDLNLLLQYQPAIQRWLLSLSSGAFAVQGLNMCLSPNILRQWRNVLDFGLAIVAADGVDPIYIRDFDGTPSRVNLFVLTGDEVQQAEDTIYTEPIQ